MNSDTYSDRRDFVKNPSIGPSSHDLKNQITKIFSFHLLTNVTPVFGTFKVSIFFTYILNT